MPWNDWKTRQRTLPAGLILLLALTLPLAGCAGRSASVRPQTELLVAQSFAADPLAASLSPCFVLEGTEARWNQIGQVEARNRGRDEVTINTAKPVIYAGSRSFTTSKGAYTNLIYRIHFPETPFSFIPFYLGAGKNVGLLVIITLDADRRPLLVTTANTCGCYAATIPTALLPPAFHPDDWPSGTIAMYGEQLPARLPALTDTTTLMVVVREDVHRVRELRVVDRATLAPGPVRLADMSDLDTLKALPLGNGALTSFYYEHWPLTGLVKGAIKPWESLLLSLVSLDFFVGTDKEYGDTRISGNPFYTSLKPWNRKTSDMNDFAAYLRFNGWRL
jgi:hypothetical protein